jgi:pimeloyl-ACP methyl ester carboxylesterase
MLHRLTIGHLDPAAAERRQTVPTKALEMDVVHRLLGEVGEKDAEGNVTLGGCKVNEFFPESELFLLPGAGHFVQMDEPEQVAQLILAMPLTRGTQV